MTVECFRLPLLMGFPVVCFNMLRFINATMGPLHRTVDCIECFSSVGNIARVFRRHGCRVATFDYIRSIELEQLCTPGRWLTAFWHAMQLKHHGLASWATVGSSWIFWSSSCTGPSRAEPWGAPPGPGITVGTADGNTMAARMICVLMLLQARGCTWLLEQPESSVMDVIPEFSYLRTCLVRLKSVMGAFNHDSRKGTTLLSCHDWHKALDRDLPSDVAPNKAITHKFIDANGIVRCTGILDELKESQAYTIEYARAVFYAHRQCLQRDVVDLSAVDFKGATYAEASIPHCRWEDIEVIGISTTKLFWEA